MIKAQFIIRRGTQIPILVLVRYCAHSLIKKKMLSISDPT